MGVWAIQPRMDPPSLSKLVRKLCSARSYGGQAAKRRE
jgi:hypothetical protein